MTALSMASAPQTQTPDERTPADARYDRPTHLRARTAFVQAHGKMPNAPMTRDECDAMAKGDPAIRTALLRMFGDKVCVS